MSEPPQLSVYYYHDNFLHLICQTNRLYRDLLSTSERDFIDDFLQLSDAAQQLYIRLLCRKGDVFRFDKLNYPEITDLRLAANSLVSNQFACWLTPEHVDEFSVQALLTLFTKPDLVQLLLTSHMAGDEAVPDIPFIEKAALNKLTRSALEELCQEYWPNIRTELFNYPLLGVYGELELTTFKLLYFGNLRQDFTDFVLRDLGIYQYEEYQIGQQSRGFSDRHQIDAYLDYYQRLDSQESLKTYDSLQLLELDQQWQRVSAAAQSYKRLLQRISRRRLEIARQLERLGDVSAALPIYSECQLHPARERQCRILFNQGEFVHCARLCLQIWKSPWIEEERQFVLAFIARLNKKLKIDAESITDITLIEMCQSIQRHKQAVKEYFLTAERDQYWQDNGVEKAALKAFLLFKQHKEALNGEGFYVENSLVNSVFGLFFWPVIFAEVPGAFYHTFQSRPDDLFEPEFLKNRQNQYAVLNQLLTDEANKPEFKRRVNQAIQEKDAIANPFVFWGLMSADYIAMLNKAIDVIPLQHWNLLFDYIWRDTKNHRSGLPDLIWLTEDTYELVEVKGPGDTLQKNQLAWLEYFSQKGIPAAVLYLKESEQS
jgi:hypothetical protein